MLFEKLALEQSMWKLLTTFKVGNSLRQRWNSGGVRTTIAKHHGRYSKSDHLCQDGVE